MAQHMDARLTPYVPYPLFAETCRSWSKAPGQREYWPNVPRLRTNLQHEDGSIGHTSRQSPTLERSQSLQRITEKITEMTEVKKHKRHWMIPGVGLSPACLLSSPAKLFTPMPSAMDVPSTDEAVAAFRPSSSVYTPAEPRNSPLYRQQAFWQTVFSHPRASSRLHHDTAIAERMKMELPDCESPTIGNQLQRQDTNNLPNDAESSNGGSATTYFSDTSGIAYFLPSALSFTSSTRSSIIKNSNDLSINTNAQSWGLGKWPSGRAVDESVTQDTGMNACQASTSSPAVLDSAHSYGWWDVLRTPFLVNTPASRASPASASGLASSMAQAQAQALKEVLLNVPSLASKTGATVMDDTSNVATMRAKTLGVAGLEGERTTCLAPDEGAVSADMSRPPPRTTSLCRDALSPRHQAPQSQSPYASSSRYLMPTIMPLQPRQQTDADSQTQTDTLIPSPLQQQRRRPPIPMPISTAPTDPYSLHPFANPPMQSAAAIASPMFFRTVLNTSNDINHNNSTTTIPRPDRPRPLPPMPNTNLVPTPTHDALLANYAPAPGSKQKGMFSKSLERVKRERGRHRDRDRDLNGMDFCCRGVPDEVVTTEFEPPPRVDRRGRPAAWDEAIGAARGIRQQERPSEVVRMPTVRDLRETRGGHGHGHGISRVEGWQGHDGGFGHQKGESIGKSVGRWMAGLMR